MKAWRCPGCGVRQEALGAFSVGHRCPTRRNHWVDFEPQEEEVGAGSAGNAGPVGKGRPRATQEA